MLLIFGIHVVGMNRYKRVDFGYHGNSFDGKIDELFIFCYHAVLDGSTRHNYSSYSHDLYLFGNGKESAINTPWHFFRFCNIRGDTMNVYYFCSHGNSNFHTF